MTSKLFSGDQHHASVSSACSQALHCVPLFFFIFSPHGPSKHPSPDSPTQPPFYLHTKLSVSFPKSYLVSQINLCAMQHQCFCHELSESRTISFISPSSKSTIIHQNQRPLESSLSEILSIFKKGDNNVLPCAVTL